MKKNSWDVTVTNFGFIAMTLSLKNTAEIKALLISETSETADTRKVLVAAFWDSGKEFILVDYL